MPPWTLPQFTQYVEIALQTMAKRGVVNIDEAPICPLQTVDGSLRIEVATDLSGIGLRDGVPIIATTQGNGPVTWSLGRVAIATIPADWTPEEAGEAIGKTQLRMAHRSLSERGQGNGKGR